jgi:hypothetical protein
LRLKLIAIAAIATLALGACKAQVRGVITIVGDSNVVAGASALTHALSNRDNGYLPVLAAHDGAVIRESSCDQPCTDTNFWAVRLADTEAKVQTDVFVVELGINDAVDPGTPTTVGYAAYDEKIDYLMGAIPTSTPVLWTNLPCALEPSNALTGCLIVNTALDAAPLRWVNLTILDWSSTATPHPEYMKPNDIHYSDAGQREYARFVVAALDQIVPEPTTSTTSTTTTTVP